MKKALRAAAFVLLVTNAGAHASAAQAPAARPPQVKEVVVTIDDVPLNSPRVGLERLRAMTGRLLAGIKWHGVPAVGFVNESQLYVPGETDGMIPVLKSWAHGGVELGNHTFSHLRFKDVPLAGATTRAALVRRSKTDSSASPT